MTALTDIIARPLLPIEFVIGLAVIAVGLIVFAIARRLKGAWLRLGSAAALIMALLDPAIVQENRAPLSDIVLVVVDESASQTIEDRQETTATALAQIEAWVANETARREAEGGASASIELEIVRVAGDGARGTELAGALSRAIAEIPPARFSAAILITDGAISDDPAMIAALVETAEGRAQAPAPIHVLATGRANEFDRRLVVENAPAYGLVDQTVTLRFRVEESGVRPPGVSAPRVRVYLDGELRGAAELELERSTRLNVRLTHPGRTVVEVRMDVEEAEITARNNVAAFSINAVRDSLEVLLVSGQPHAGERTWRNLLKSDASVLLAHFTILRPPGREVLVPSSELALIPFPTQELFEDRIREFDLIIFDRYRHWRGILADRYLANIVDYVRGGGAVLVSAGPAFAGFESLAGSPLRSILPASPTGRILERPFRPLITELGARHPVTRGLAGSGLGEGEAFASIEQLNPTWGRWFRQIDVAGAEGDILLEGPEERPLVMLNRVGQGRVALIASDHTYLWARGYDGGGPQAELLRRLAHWLMREPDLEEEALTAEPAPGGFIVERRSLALGDKVVSIRAPDGTTSEATLTPAGDGLWRAEIASDVLGVHEIRDADRSEIGSPREPLSAVAVVGPPAPEEFANPVSTFDTLRPLIEASGGGAIRLATVDGAPELRRIAAGRAGAGDDWIGLPRREAYEVRGVSLSGVAPPWIFFAIAAFFALAAWRVEGR